MSQSFSIGSMLLGVATSATQIEGGDTNNSWYDWSQKGGVKDGSTPLRANNHWHLYKEDIQLMADMKLQVYRFGIEWSRIEPEQGRFDAQALQHYRDELLLLREKNILPLLTLHHFTNPLWFEQMGAFEHPESPLLFLKFVEYVVNGLGDLVSEYITINEPNVYTVHGYIFGLWPPGKKNDLSALQTIFGNFTASHILAYNKIHQMRKEKGYSDTKVSFANHLRWFSPRNKWNPIDQLAAKLLDYAFQDSLTKAMCTGQFSFPVKKTPHCAAIKKGIYYDFTGINYYTRGAADYRGDGTFDDVAKNDLGWEIYPEGLAGFVKRFYKKYPAPIYITENGTCDHKDSFRAAYIYNHLKGLVETGLPIERYYHWTFIDNFEWAEGEVAPFGLVALNFETQERTVRKSGRFFTQIIENRGVTQKMYEEWGGELGVRS